MSRIYILASIVALLLAGCAAPKKNMPKKSKANSSAMPKEISQAKNDSERYLLTFYPMAVEQMERHGIPASITLAQGLLESGAGKSKLASEGKNHFGIKADKRWKGRTMKVMDNGALHKFRVYDNAGESYEDHSQFLIVNKRYASLFRLKKTDYKGWAKGLRDAYYAEDRQYHTKLVALIERYRLYEYDSYTMSDIKNGRKEGNPKSIALNRSIYKSNGLLYVTARQGDTFETLSKELGISKNKLISYNDLHKGYKIEEGDIIYLEKKRSKALEKYSFHRTRNGESLYRISQIYGIRLENLYKMNPQYSSYTRLKVGDVIRLR
ncbi:MAG: glucosaminidase domain-containing protein [Bacteroidaceae bacterium]|nr:glucosaminidase domain-containing protein [Bacteroidaceae bacterium]